ncbi:hypothetical protein HanXRQr2_Chr15g0700851 [Helianthus annuus]|uniref:Uncharacterized protein n=1 Tax=Helianthus annuus TaxID=4232 RepID=A0A9K3H2P4_HELAN|nr:hypothetical protein HanXRQr2_Chr15g0700851 [Helianthus annuus]KAJ0831900.1 hypothetical protein HanPSC8_Chr15g0672511 [Helianthus annuus]
MYSRVQFEECKAIITFLQRATVSVSNLHHHFDNKAIFASRNGVKPSPHASTNEVILLQQTQLFFCLSSLPP